MSKFDLDVLHQTISDTQSNICQAVIVKEGKLIYADAWNAEWWHFGIDSRVSMD